MSAPAPGPFGSKECGCTIDKLGNYIDITYCPTHEAAPTLLAACVELNEVLSLVVEQRGADRALKNIGAAIAKARGE